MDFCEKIWPCWTFSKSFFIHFHSDAIDKELKGSVSFQYSHDFQPKTFQKTRKIEEFLTLHIDWKSFKKSRFLFSWTKDNFIFDSDQNYMLIKIE